MSSLDDMFIFTILWISTKKSFEHFDYKFKYWILLQSSSVQDCNEWLKSGNENTIFFSNVFENVIA